jgi:hypothetical protein
VSGVHVACIIIIMMQQLVEVEGGGSSRDVNLSITRQISYAAMKVHGIFCICA